MDLNEINHFIGGLACLGMTARAQIEIAKREEVCTDDFERKCIKRAEHYEEIVLVMNEIVDKAVAAGALK